MYIYIYVPGSSSLISGAWLQSIVVVLLPDVEVVSKVVATSVPRPKYIHHLIALEEISVGIIFVDGYPWRLSCSMCLWVVIKVTYI